MLLIASPEMDTAVLFLFNQGHGSATTHNMCKVSDLALHSFQVSDCQKPTGVRIGIIVAFLCINDNIFFSIAKKRGKFSIVAGYFVEILCMENFNKEAMIVKSYH